MPLRNRYYLSDLSVATDDANKHRFDDNQDNSAWIRPLWILPRAWCVTTSLQAKGVPLHKTAAFVKLHLGRLAPFADSGVYACRSGDWVHLWFWENQKVREFCVKYKLDFSSLHLAPESVCFPKQKNAAVFHQCLYGVEAQLWHQGMLIDSAWWPAIIDEDTWQKWLPSAEASSGARAVIAAWPTSLPSLLPQVTPRDISSESNLSEPWAYNLLGKKWWHVLKEIRSDKLLLLALACFTLWAGYLGAQWWTVLERQRVMEMKIESLTARVEPLNIARAQALASQQWVNKLAALRSHDDIKELLSSLQSVLQEQEAALREFEYLDGEIRLTLVPVNTELNIVALTQDLEALPKFTNIRLLPDSDARITRYSAKLQRLGNPSEIKVLGVQQIRENSVKTSSTPFDRSGKREKGE
jgi:hypothetical protein